MKELLVPIVAGVFSVIVSCVSLTGSWIFDRRLTNLIDIRQKTDNQSEKDELTKQIQYELANKSQPFAIRHPHIFRILLSVVFLLCIAVILLLVWRNWVFTTNLQVNDFLSWLKNEDPTLYSCVTHDNCTEQERNSIPQKAIDWVNGETWQSPYIWFNIIFIIILFGLVCVLVSELFQKWGAAKRYEELSRTGGISNTTAQSVLDANKSPSMKESAVQEQVSDDQKDELASDLIGNLIKAHNLHLDPDEIVRHKLQEKNDEIVRHKLQEKNDEIVRHKLQEKN